MKLIFDFDDVLFKNTPEFKEHIFRTIAETGIPRVKIEEQYKEVRKSGKEFSLLNFLNDLLGNDDLYEKIMQKCPELLNEEMIEKAREVGKENCYLITNGNKDFQEDKIKRSGIAPLFNEIIIVPGSKKEFVEKICSKNPDEEIIFYDDKEIFFADLDREKYKNLKKILYKRN